MCVNGRKLYVLLSTLKVFIRIFMYAHLVQFTHTLTSVCVEFLGHCAIYTSIFQTCTMTPVLLIPLAI